MLLIDANIALRYILNDDKEQAQRVRDIYASTNFDFVDCVLAGYYEAENREIATLDVDLQKLIARIGNG
ncbi:hypothetical protein R83H12_01091 [Fibrobacteria bacterium R8-3-H12]